MRWVRCCAATCLAILALPAACAAAWLELRSANFLVLGSVSERELRDTARQLEQLRALLVRISPKLASTSPVPTVVLVFSGSRAFEPFQPIRDGRRASAVIGYFQSGDTANYIALNADGPDGPVRVVFHEYLHFLVSNNFAAAPAWLSEGLAQLFESTQLSSDGRTALIGVPLLQQLALARQLPFDSLGGTMRTTDPVPLHDGTAWRGYYARAWALLHYLVLGNPVRSAQLDGYLERLAAGAEADAAFDAVFSGDIRQLEQELARYVQQTRFTGRLYTFDEPVTDGVIPQAAPLADADAEPYLADLLAHTGREQEARQRLERLLADQPSHARAAAALGRLDLRAQRVESALSLLERAAALAPDDASVQSALGTALYEAALRHSANGTAAGDTLARAHAVLTHAASLDPPMAPTLVALAHAELARTGDAARARELLAAAVTLAPSRRDYKRALDDLVGERSPGAGATRRLALRVLRDGEVRVAGRFVRIDCATAIPQYLVEADGGMLRLDTIIAGVQIIRYAPAPERLGCGEVPGTPYALVTYLPAPRGDSARAGDVVAIEIVPEGYRP